MFMHLKATSMHELVKPYEEGDKSVTIVRDFSTMIWVDMEAHIELIKSQL